MSKRKRKGKKIRDVFVRDLIFYAIISPIVITAIWICTPLLIVPAVSYAWGVVIYILAGIITYFFTKKFLIGLILCYKVLAPLEMRDNCRFIPTCSTYMMMAINKYGIVIGIIKGIKRIHRCKIPNGGVDYP